MKQAGERLGQIPSFVYIGRRGQGYGGDFGNPYTLDHYTRDEACDLFDQYLEQHPELVDQLAALNPTHLVCFCAPLRCHGLSYQRELEKR